MTSIPRFASRRRSVIAAPQYDDVDLAIVAESTYPYLLGGVSAVIHDIARANPDRSVGIIHIAWDSNCPTEHVYEVPPNVRWVYPVFLSMNDHVEDFKLVPVSALQLGASQRRELSDEVFAAVEALAGGDTGPFWRLYDRVLNPRTRTCPPWPLLTTQEFMTSALGRFAEFSIPFTELFWLLREFFSLTCAIAGADYPRARVYHSHTTGYAGLLAAIAARQNSGRVLLTEHNLYTRDTVNTLLGRKLNTVVTASDWHADSELDPEQRAWVAWYTEIGRLIYQSADQITYLYPEAIAEAEGLGSDAAKSKIIANGMLLDKFESARARFLERRAETDQLGGQPTWRLAYCARLVPIKGLIDLISGVAELVQAGVTHFTLDVMGHAEEQPEYAAACEQRARDLKLDDHVRFLGNKNVADVLGDYDIAILPSYNEGQPLAVMEAMSVGLPIIGTPVGGMEQLILSSLDDGPGPGPCGVLVRPGDAAGLADAVRRLISDQALYNFFSENSRSRISQYFGLEKAMDAYRAIYSRLENAPALEPSLIPAPRTAEVPQPLRSLESAETSDMLLAEAVSAADQQLRVLSRPGDWPPWRRSRLAPGGYGRLRPATDQADAASDGAGQGGPVPRPRSGATGRDSGVGTVLRLGSGRLRSRLAAAGAAAGLAVGTAAGAFGLAAAQPGPGQSPSHLGRQASWQHGGRHHPVTALQGSPRAGTAGGAAAGFPGTGVAGSAVGALGSFQVGMARLTLTEPAHDGPSGRPVGPRTLRLGVRYPAAGVTGKDSARPAADRAGTGSLRTAAGQFPLIVFAPGFGLCGFPYAPLLHAWASAGYVVAVVNFPHSDCLAGAIATTADLINQPADVSYAITRLLAAGAARNGLLAGLLNPAQVAVAGQAGGGDTVAAVAANSCCADRRIAAVAVLSGAEWPSMPGPYFRGRTPPMLFVQGSADQLNPPAASLRLFRGDRSRARYYLDLPGAGHLTPYVGASPQERLIARVTLAFFDRWVLGQLAAGPAITAAGTRAGVAALVSGGRLPPR